MYVFKLVFVEVIFEYFYYRGLSQMNLKPWLRNLKTFALQNFVELATNEPWQAPVEDFDQ